MKIRGWQPGAASRPRWPSASPRAATTTTAVAAAAAAVGGGSLTVYSSLPLQGASRPQSEDVIKGIKLALKQKGGKCGDFTIKYESLDDATAAAGKWEAGQTSANARKVAQDDSAIAYIGEFNSGASAISIPITNEAGHPAGQPVQHGARPDEGRRGRRAGRAGQVLPDRQAQLRSRRADRHDPGRRPGAVHEGRGRATASTSSTTPRSTARASRRTRRPPRRSSGIEIAGEDSWDGKASNYRALAVEDQVQRRGRRLHRRHHRQQRAAAVQGPRTQRCRMPSCSAPTASRPWTSPRRSRRRSRRRRT